MLGLTKELLCIKSVHENCIYIWVSLNKNEGLDLIAFTVTEVNNTNKRSIISQSYFTQFYSTLFI